MLVLPTVLMMRQLGEGALCQVFLASVQNDSASRFLKSTLRQGKSLSLSTTKALIPPGSNMGNDYSQ